MKLRVGDRVRVIRPPALAFPEGVSATIRSMGKDSAGPWVCVELEDGTTEVVSPNRLKKVAE